MWQRNIPMTSLKFFFATTTGYNRHSQPSMPLGGSGMEKPWSHQTELPRHGTCWDSSDQRRKTSLCTEVGWCFPPCRSTKTKWQNFTRASFYNSLLGEQCRLLNSGLKNPSSTFLESQALRAEGSLAAAPCPACTLHGVGPWLDPCCRCFMDLHWSLWKWDTSKSCSSSWVSPWKPFFCVIPLLFLLDPYCWKKCEMVGGLIENRQACWIGPWLLGSTHTGMCWLFESHIWLPNLHAWSLSLLKSPSFQMVHPKSKKTTYTYPIYQSYPSYIPTKSPFFLVKLPSFRC